MNLLNPFWLSMNVGGIVGLSIIAEMQFWGLPIALEMAAVEAIFSAPVAVIALGLGVWVGGTMIGCALACATDPCSYQ